MRMMTDKEKENLRSLTDKELIKLLAPSDQITQGFAEMATHGTTVMKWDGLNMQVVPLSSIVKKD